MNNPYMPFLSRIQKVIRHTDIEYTFRMHYVGEVKPGQFFEVSVSKYGKSPISVSGIGPDYVDLTIRKVGKVTNEIFENQEGKSLFMRGPYGNGFLPENYRGKELVIVAGGACNADVLTQVAEIAREYGNGQVHITTRQGFEIEGISIRDMAKVNEKLQPIIENLEINQEVPGTGYASSETRNVSACIKGCDQLSVDALHMENYKIVRNTEKCVGCSVCVTKCPTRAWTRSQKKYYRLTIMGRTGKKNPRLGEDFLLWADEDTIVPETIVKDNVYWSGIHFR